MELIDTHAHLTFGQLKDRTDAVIQRACDAGVIQCITVATEPAEIDEVIALADKYDCVFAALGYHPHIAKDVTENDLARLKDLCSHPKVVAIGETGLDFHYNFSAQPAQEEIFIRHLRIAAETNLPVIIHSRNAFEETLKILDSNGGGIERIVFHCFGETAERAKIILDKDWHISFTGVVTFKNAHDTRQAAKLVPLDKLMVETDCPYMSPEPKRNKKPNEPALLTYTARFIAELKDIAAEDFAVGTTKTARTFFNLPVAQHK